MVRCHEFGLDGAMRDNRLLLALPTEWEKKSGGTRRGRENTPEVLLILALSPAKSASENSPSRMSSGASPMSLICRHPVDPIHAFNVPDQFSITEIIPLRDHGGQGPNCT